MSVHDHVDFFVWDAEDVAEGHEEVSMREGLVVYGLDVADIVGGLVRARYGGREWTYIFSLAAAEYMHLETVSLLTHALQGVRRSHFNFNRLHYPPRKFR